MTLDNATITLGIFIIGHLGITIWWASRVNTLLEFVQNKLSEITVELKATYKIAMPREIAEKEHAAMWLKIDYLLDKVNKQ